jgi:energy-coupling factor transporter transmembrane protein EcfT
VKKYYDEYNNIKDSTLKKIDLKKQIDDIQGAKNRFDETEEKACKDVYDFFHDRANKHLKKTYLSAIALVFVFSFLGILFLLFYYKCKSNVFRILFVVIWNILMLFMLYCILLGFVFGILAYVLEDGVRVVQYIVSSENLKNQDPLFVKSNSYVSDLIDACANGEGDFLKAINKKKDIDESIKKLDDIKNQNKDIQNELDKSNCTNKAYFQNIYNSLNGRTDQIKGNLTALKDINCAFAKNDKNIILNEMDSGSKKAKGMCALSLLIGFLLGISILTGILFVHKYRYGDTSQEEKVVEVKQNVGNDSGVNMNNGQNTTAPTMNFETNTQIK